MAGVAVARGCSNCSTLKGAATVTLQPTPEQLLRAATLLFHCYTSASGESEGFAGTEALKTKAEPQQMRPLFFSPTFPPLKVADKRITYPLFVPVTKAQ